MRPIKYNCARITVFLQLHATSVCKCSNVSITFSTEGISGAKTGNRS